MRKTYGPLKAKNCSIGVQCKGTCISKNKSCVPVVKNPAKVIKAVELLKAKLGTVSPELSIKNPKPLGKGFFGFVTGNDKEVLKTMTFIEKNTAAKVLKESELQNAVNKLGFAPKVLAHNKTQILSERAKGTLANDLNLTPETLKNFTADRNNALLAMHKKGIAHNDVHMQNIFYDESKRQVTFIDFGMSRRNKPSSLFYEYSSLMKGAIKEEYGKEFDNQKEYLSWLKSL